MNKKAYKIFEIAEINSEVHMPQWPPDTEDFPAQHSEGRNEKW